MTLEITDVLIFFIVPNKGHIGFASISINNSIRLNSIAIHQKRSGGYRLTYPLKGDYPIYYPSRVELSKAIEQAVFEQLSKLDTKDVNTNDRHYSINT